MKLYTNCSEYVCHLGIKKAEMPYVKKRINALFKDAKDRKYLLEHFTHYIDKKDEKGFGSFICTEEFEPYNKITGELMAKRKVVCPFCKEIIKNEEHIKKEHKEELKIVLSKIDEKEFKQIRKEALLDGLTKDE